MENTNIFGFYFKIPLLHWEIDLYNTEKFDILDFLKQVDIENPMQIETYLLKTYENYFQHLTFHINSKVLYGMHDFEKKEYVHRKMTYKEFQVISIEIIKEYFTKEYLKGLKLFKNIDKNLTKKQKEINNNIQQGLAIEINKTIENLFITRFTVIITHQIFQNIFFDNKYTIASRFKQSVNCLQITLDTSEFEEDNESITMFKDMIPNDMIDSYAISEIRCDNEISKYNDIDFYTLELHWKFIFSNLPENILTYEKFWISIYKTMAIISDFSFVICGYNPSTLYQDFEEAIVNRKISLDDVPKDFSSQIEYILGANSEYHPTLRMRQLIIISEELKIKQEKNKGTEITDV